MRWGGDPPSCPYCAHERCYFLTPTDPSGRRTRTGTPSARRIWKCAACRRQFSVRTGTIFAGSQVPLQVWTAVIADVLGPMRCPDAAVLAARHAVTAETAGHMIARLTGCGPVAVVPPPPPAAAEPPGDLPGDQVLRVLLTLDADTAARVRAMTGRRRRPRRQDGPSADYG